jgi:hypothetical protein
MSERRFLKLSLIPRSILRFRTLTCGSFDNCLYTHLSELIHSLTLTAFKFLFFFLSQPLQNRSLRIRSKSHLFNMHYLSTLGLVAAAASLAAANKVTFNNQ